MSAEATFVDVVIPIAIPNLLTYRVSRELEAHVRFGQRVIVPLGRGKLYTAVIHQVHHNPPKAYTAKYIEFILDEVPVVRKSQMQFWEWMAAYYMCTLGEVLGMALPSSLKLASESKLVSRVPLQEVQEEDLNDQEFLVMEALEMRNELTLAEVGEVLGLKSVHKLIKGLVDRGFVTTLEELRQGYKPKTEAYLMLQHEFQSEEALHLLCNELERRAPKQLDLLMAYLQEDPTYEAGVPKVKLQKKASVSPAVTKQLLDKGVFSVCDVEVDRLSSYKGATEDAKDLSDEQTRALHEVTQQFESKDVVLLHGVTGSGKTEIYVRLIEETLLAGKQVLYLLPEIALTTQLITRLQRYFGDKVGVYHSKFNQQERAETWMRVMREGDNHYPIIIGARSAVFLPFRKLGLVIVDEEHESSFKQYDPAPRYNGRDAGVVLGMLHKAKVLLGSATPSLESYYNAQEGRYGLVELLTRYGDVIMPEVLCADIVKERKKRTMKEHFSRFLLDEMEAVLKAGKQVILFQNRRGYAPLWQCRTCGWVPECTRCDVSLTYHKRVHHLNCHYCGYTEVPPGKCKACGSTDMQTLGFGTERIEEDLMEHFPKARVARMDLDTTRSKNAYAKLLQAFDLGEIDVLVGTQMVTKGLDFEHVALVGVMNADVLLKFPDFRSNERAFQLMVQVSGRSGRKHERGKVIVQTYDPGHWVIRRVIDHDYMGMYRHELLERKNYHYPPYTRLVRLNLRHKNEGFLRGAAKDLASLLRAKLGQRVFGPEAPAVARVNNYYHQNILLKLEREGSPAKFKEAVREVIDTFQQSKENRSVRIVPDVDPA